MYAKAPMCCTGSSTRQPLATTRVSMNFPLPGETGPAALVKVYDGLGDSIKLNDVIEVYAVTSTDPALSQFSTAEYVPYPLLDFM